MKNLIFYLLIIIFIFNACDTNKNFKRHEDNTVFYGKVKSIIEKGYGVKEKFGELQRDGTLNTSYYFYDLSGNMIKEQVEGGNWDSTLFNYNSEGRLLVAIHYDNGSEKAKTKYEYDDSFKKRKEIYSYGSNIVIRVSTYDINNNRIELIEYNDDGSPSTKHTYKYDSRGNLIRESYQLPDEEVKWIEYRYDNKNNKLKELRENVIDFNYKYQGFDNSGNWLKRITLSDEPFYIIERQIEYFN